MDIVTTALVKWIIIWPRGIQLPSWKTIQAKNHDVGTRLGFGTIKQ
jgi:hypothetical protein